VGFGVFRHLGREMNELRDDLHWTVESWKRMKSQDSIIEEVITSGQLMKA